MAVSSPATWARGRVWSVDDSSRLTGGRYFVGDQPAKSVSCLTQCASRRRSQSMRGYEGTTPQAWAAGTRVRSSRPRAASPPTRSGARPVEHHGHGRREPQSGWRRAADRGVGWAVQVHRLLGGLQIRRGRLALPVVERGPREAHCPRERARLRKVASPTRRRSSTISTSGRS